MIFMATGNEDTTKPAGDIDRLALKISLADDDVQFEKVVRKSLTFILRYIAMYEDNRKKLMEILGDVTRRLKCRTNIQIPVHDLLLTYNDPSNLTFLVNFSHLYIKLGYQRLPFHQQVNLLPALYASLTADKPTCQRDAFLHMTLPLVGRVTLEMVPKNLGLLELPTQRRFVTDFYSLIILTPYNLQRLVRTDSGDSCMPDGFNSYDLTRVIHERFSTIASCEELEKLKLGLIQFYSRQFFPAEESILPILLGYGDTRHSVVSAASKELRTLSMVVDWEDEILLRRIMTWYLGHRREFDPKGRNEPRRPLSAAMRIKIGHYLLRSRCTLPGPLSPSLVEAALLALEPSLAQSHLAYGSHLTNPNNVPVAVPPPPPPPPPPSGPPLNGLDWVGGNMCDVHCMDGGRASPPCCPLRRAANEEAAVATAAASISAQRSPHPTTPGLPSVQQRKRLAEHGLDLLAHLLNNVPMLHGPTSIAALRCLINFVYERNVDEFTTIRSRGFELLSRFLSRDPSYLLKDPAQLPRLFDILSEENQAEVKLAAANCLRRLAITLQEIQRQNYPALRNQLGKLERLLYENIEKPDPLCRLVAVNFAGLIYPSDHIPTRYLILQALGDKDQNVRKEACMAFEQFLDPNIIHDIVYGRVKLPSFVEFVNHDTQHSRKNPFVEVERLIPVVQFIRLCLLATRGGLTSTQENGLTYETEDEVRYLVNQTVRYFLSAGSQPIESINGQQNVTNLQSQSGGGGTDQQSSCGHQQINPEQAKRSIDTYFRLIQVVIFTRSQQTKDSPNFPNYLEEVLVGNTKELITCNKQLFERMNNVLLATPRGANCRHACASVYSVVVMETETPTQALKTAKKMLTSIPSAGTQLDNDNSHTVQGMFMGAAYLLERLFTRHVLNPSNAFSPGNATENQIPPTNTGGTSSKKSKKEKQQQQQQQQNAQQQSLTNKQSKQLRSDIVATIEHLVNLMSPFLVKPNFLLPPLHGSKEHKRSSGANMYMNVNIGQSTVATLLDALMVLARAGCLAHLPTGSLPINGELPSSLTTSKAVLIQRIAAYLPSPTTYSMLSASANRNEMTAVALSGQLHVAQVALRALAACCMGELSDQPDGANSSIKSSTVVKSNGNPSISTTSHPHTVAIMKLLTDTAEINDPGLHLAVGISLTDCLLGPNSPLKKHWYERSYPLIVPIEAIQSVVNSSAGRWLASQLATLLGGSKGSKTHSKCTLAAVFWALALVRRIGPLPKSLLPDRLLIDLLEGDDESVQSVVVATLGQIYDRSPEESRTDLVTRLTKTILGTKAPHGSLVYRELCELAQQIGRPDLGLSLIVLALAPPPNTRLSCSTPQSNVSCNLAASVTYAGLVRRLGRALAPTLPRLVPRIFVRRFDYARPKVRQAMEHVWLGLVAYASAAPPPLPSCTSPTNLSMAEGTKRDVSEFTQPTQQIPGYFGTGSLQVLSSELIEAYFNAIIFEIKTLLGFNTSGSQSPPNNQSSNPISSPPIAAARLSPNADLKDACCLAIANLTNHPAADRKLAGHLPALLSGLMSLCDEDGGDQNIQASRDSDLNKSGVQTPAEEAAIAVQKLVIRVLENPCSRDAASGLLPGLLPVIIDRAPWNPVSNSDSDKSTNLTNNHLQFSGESRRLALELLLAAARSGRPTALRPALPQLILTGLHNMSSVHPSRVATLMRQPAYYQLQMHSSPAVSPTSTVNGSASQMCHKEFQMAEVLRLSVRLMDDVSLSRLIVPFTELIRAGGGVPTTNASTLSPPPDFRESISTATATCVFLSHLAAANSSAHAAASMNSRMNTCARCASMSSATANSAMVNGTDHALSSSDSPPAQRQRHPAGNKPASTYATPCTNSFPNEFASLVPHTGKLLAALLSALPGACRLSDPTGETVQVEMARTLASLLRFAKHTSVAKLFNRVRSWYLNPDTVTCAPTTCPTNPSETSSPSISHLACARVMYAVTHHCPELLYAHAGITLPLLFINRRFDPDVMGATHQPNHRQPNAQAPTATTTLFPELIGSVELLDGSLTSCISTPDTTNRKSKSERTPTDFELLGMLWKQTWNELITKLPMSACLSRENSSTADLQRFVFPISTNGVGGDLLTSFLYPPLLEQCLQLINEALANPMNSEIRAQASLAILYLAARFIGQSPCRSPTTANVGTKVARPRRRSRPSGAEDSSNGPQESDNVYSSGTRKEQEPPTNGSESTSNGEGDADETDDISVETDVVQNEDELRKWTVNAWLSLAQVTTRSLGISQQSWFGKACVLRSSRLLSIFARKRGWVIEPWNKEVIEQLWSALCRVTSTHSSECGDPGYRADAFLSLASFAEIASRDATIGEDVNGEPEDRLNNLFQLIVPGWNSDCLEQLKINPNLSESGLVLAVTALGTMWPNEYCTEIELRRFNEMLTILNFVGTTDNPRVQAACFASVIGILTKITPEQSSQLVRSSENSNTKPLTYLGIKDLLDRIRNAARNSQYQPLREHALGTLTTIIQHSSFVSLCRDEVVGILQAFSNDTVTSLRECSTDLLKEL